MSNEEGKVISLCDYVKEQEKDEREYVRYRAGAVDLQYLITNIENAKDLTEKYYEIYSTIDRVTTCSIRGEKVTIVAEDGDFVFKYQVFRKNK